jgi:hypothetical protein
MEQRDLSKRSERLFKLHCMFQEMWIRVTPPHPGWWGSLNAMVEFNKELTGGYVRKPYYTFTKEMQENFDRKAMERLKKFEALE